MPPPHSICPLQCGWAWLHDVVKSACAHVRRTADSKKDKISQPRKEPFGTRCISILILCAPTSASAAVLDFFSCVLHVLSITIWRRMGSSVRIFLLICEQFSPPATAVAFGETDLRLSVTLVRRATVCFSQQVAARYVADLTLSLLGAFVRF